MKRLIIGLVLMCFANPAFAQVQASDYTDTSKWKYEKCDADFIQPEDKNYLVWHEDYVLVGETFENATKIAVVVYKPTEREVLDNEGPEKFISVSKNNPWLLIDVDAVNFSVNLFEYQNNMWKFKKTFDSDGEFMEFMWQEYKLQ